MDMKTFRFYFICVSMLLMVFGIQSCQQELLEPENHDSNGIEMIFTAFSEGNTKTSRQEDKTVWWSPSEEINVFYANMSSSKFVSLNEESSPVAQFKGSLDSFTGSNEQDAGAQYFYAIYPYSFDNKCKDDVLTLYIPHQQSAVANTFDNGMFPSVARSSGLNLAFYNVCGGIKFSVSRNDIKKIALSGNNNEILAGKTSVKFDSEGIPVVECQGDETTIYLTPRETATFSTETYYYITLPQIVLEGGIKMTFYTTDNKQGVFQTDNSIEIKRSVFASKDGIDSGVTEWTDVPASAGTESGFYLGVMGFNQNLNSYPVTYLTEESKDSFNDFIDSMEMKKGTLLYYSVDNAITTFQNTMLPEDVFNIAIVTFTDGLDQGSLMMNFDYFTDEEYLEAVNNRLMTEKVAGQYISAYSIGIKGSDVTDEEKFINNLQKLASSSENAYEVLNMSEMNEKFQEIADKLDENSYVQKMSVCIPGQANGTKVRFTFDNVSDASLSQLYVEGVFNLRERSLEQVEYCGFTSTSGSTVKGVVDGIFVTFTFDGVRTAENILVAQEYIQHWNYVASTSSWQINSEFDNEENSSIVNEKKSAAIMLVLDCSSSLGDQFENMKEHAKSFVYSLYKASSVESDDIYPVYPSDYLSTTPLDLSLAVVRNGVRYYVSQSEYPKLDLGAYTIEGLTVISGDEAFLMALDERPVNAVYWDYANAHYELPDYDQGVVISARWSDINAALEIFGGDRLSTYNNYYYWTSTVRSGNNTVHYYISSSGGSLGYDSSYNKFRQVIDLNDLESSDIPYLFNKSDELTLAITDGTERRFLTLDQYQRGGVPAGYEAEGVAVKSKNENFIISLHNASADPMYYSAAVQLYGDQNFPTISQCKIIGARWGWIQDALIAFGGDAIEYGSTDTMAVKSGSNYYYLDGSSHGTAISYTFDYKNYVRLIVDTF